MSSVPDNSLSVSPSSYRLPSSLDISRTQNNASASQSKVPNRVQTIKDHSEVLSDYLSKDAFSKLINSTNGQQLLMRFLETEKSTENLKFWITVKRIKETHAQLLRLYHELYKAHLAENAPLEVNVPGNKLSGLREEVVTMIRQLDPGSNIAEQATEGIPNSQNISIAVNNSASIINTSTAMLDVCQQDIFNLMFQDSFVRFVKHQLRTSTQTALKGALQNTFLGLGDCYCLTDVTLPDNPVVLASDGFLQVT
ncbi:hypothetical protein HK102_003207, partial [Quaeritorhiza haematococci]